MSTMKLQKDTKKKEAPEIFLRTRATPDLKSRLESHAKRIDRSEGWILRTAVTEFLDKQKAA